MIITHQMSVVREICSHVAIMKEGCVVETGAVSDVFAHPKSEVAKELLRKDTLSDKDNEIANTAKTIEKGQRVRIVFSENSAFEPVIANLILTFVFPPYLTPFSA